MSHAAFIGEPVRVEIGTRTVTGNLVGIDEGGALVIQDERGERHGVAAGDLVRGPRIGAG